MAAHSLILPMLLTAAGPRVTSSAIDLEAAVDEKVRLETTRRAALGSKEFEIKTTRASVDGVPYIMPMAKSLVSREGDDARVMALAFTPSLPLTTEPLVTNDEALVLANAAGGDVELVLVPWPNETRLMWKVEAPLDWEALSKPIYVVDALSGAVHFWAERVQFARVRAYESNPVRTPNAKIFELNDIDPFTPTLSGPNYRAFGCFEPSTGSGACQPGFGAVANAEGDFLYDAPDLDIPSQHRQLTDEFAETSVYYHADKFHQYLQELGVPGTPCHADGSAATLVANYRFYVDGDWAPVANAAYVASCSITVLLGQGFEADWGYEGDVIYHELTHGVVEYLVDGVLTRRSMFPNAVNNDAGAINEGVADFLAADFTGDSEHAEYPKSAAGEETRNAQNAYSCSGSVAGQVHADSEVLSGALWDVRSVLGPDFTPVVLDGISLIPLDSSLPEAIAAIRQVVVEELGEEAATTYDNLVSRRDLIDCPRVVAWEELEREMWLRPSGRDGNFDPMRPPPLQLSFDVPDDATKLKVDFDIEVIPDPGWEPIGDVHVIFQIDAPFEFTYLVGPEDTITVEVDSEPAEYLASVNEGTLELDVPPGSTVYAAFFNQGLHNAIISNLRAEFSEPPAGETGSSGSTGEQPDPDTDTDTDTDVGQTESESGCGCTSMSNTTPPHLLLLFVLFAPRVIRRKRAGLGLGGGVRGDRGARLQHD